jgi:HK97 family phage portal protein
MSKNYDVKAILTIPAWAEAMHEGGGLQKDTIKDAAAAYAFVPLVYRAVRLRADSLAKVPIRFTKLDGETEVKPPFPEDVDWKDLIWKSEAALCLQGANFVEKLQRRLSNKTGGVQWVDPTTMNKPKLIRGGDGKIDYEFSQKANPNVTWNLATMIYMHDFALGNEVGPGVSAAGVSLNDSALVRYMSRFASHFFESGAMPITVLSIDGVVDRQEAQRIESFFKRAATRIRNAFSVLALSRGIEPKIISQPLKDLAMPELNEQARHAVALAFGIPQTMLEDAANYATSAEHRLSFWQDTVQPRGEWLAEQFNRQLLKDFKIKMAFGFEELDVFQADENERGDSLNKIVTAINLNPGVARWAMGVLGYDLTEEQTNDLQKIIAEKEKEKEKVQEQIEGAPTAPAQSSPLAQPEQKPAKSAWADDLSRWERKALRVIKESGSAVCEFESERIPVDLRAEITAGLPACKSADAVRELFGVDKTLHLLQEPAPEPAALELARSINALADAYVKSQAAPPAPEPIVIINSSRERKARRSIVHAFAKDIFQQEESNG